MAGEVPDADLVVSTVVSGAADSIAEAVAGSAPLIVDIIYDPWPTVLAAAAERAGCTVVNGLDLLVGQALLQIELMTGRSVSSDVLYAAAARRRRARLLIMLRWLTAGESHGPALVAILEGLPAHVLITSGDIADALARRRLGFGRGARMKFEADAVTILGGVRHGETQGGPIAIQVANSEWPKWESVMAADPVPPSELEGQARSAALTRPRPGHADLVGMQKYDFEESRPVLERASARETAARVALGRVASAFLQQAFGVSLLSHVVELGTARAPAGVIPTAADLAAIDDDPVRCFDREASAAMVAEVEQAQRTATRSAVLLRSSSGACRPGWVPTFTGIAAWTRSSRVR